MPRDAYRERLLEDAPAWIRIDPRNLKE